MKSRMLIPLSVVLVAVLLLVGVAPRATTPEPVHAQVFYYVYSVKFVCGLATDCIEGVKPANYATEINIHNPSETTVNVSWKVVRLYPTPRKITGWRAIKLAPDDGRNIRCYNICNRLKIGFPPPKFVTGFVVFQSEVEQIDVAAVYTMKDEVTGGVSIDVEYVGPPKQYPAKF